MNCIRILLLLAICSMGLNGFSQASNYDTLIFSKADSIANLYIDYDLREYKALANLLTTNLSTDVEKFRAIFRWITNNISYDVKLYNLRIKKINQLRYSRNQLKKWNKRFSKRTYRRTIQKKLAICAGYSLLLKNMCDEVGIKTVIVEGYSKTEKNRIGSCSVDHAWNAVFLNGRWYLADVTWAAGGVTFRSNFIKKFNENYFLTDPHYFIAEHFPRDESWTLLYNKPTLKEFIAQPIKTGGFIENKINTYFPEKGLLKLSSDSTLVFKFTSNKAEELSTVATTLLNRDSYSVQHHSLIKDENGEYYFEFKPKEKGFFRLSISVDGYSTFIYEIRIL